MAAKDRLLAVLRSGVRLRRTSGALLTSVVSTVDQAAINLPTARGFVDGSRIAFEVEVLLHLRQLLSSQPQPFEVVHVEVVRRYAVSILAVEFRGTSSRAWSARSRWLEVPVWPARVDGAAARTAATQAWSLLLGHAFEPDRA